MKARIAAKVSLDFPKRIDAYVDSLETNAFGAVGEQSDLPPPDLFWRKR